MGFLRRIEQLESRRLLAADFMAADFNNDNSVDALDIDLLVAEVRRAGQDSRFDLTEDGRVAVDDLDYLVEALIGTTYGDADLDRDVDFVDFLNLSRSIGDDAGWSGGDFDLQQGTAFSDFLVLSANFGSQRTTFAFTHQTASGNRYVSGWGDLPNSTPVDIPLDFVPAWVVGATDGSRQVWAAVGSSGEAQLFEAKGDQWHELDVDSSALQAGVPPLLQLKGEPAFVIAPDVASGVPSHPIHFGESSRAWIDADGNLLVEQGELTETLPVDALPDTRIVTDGAGRLLLLTDPTTRYAHGVLGDRIEAASFTIVDTNNSPPSVFTANVPVSRVIEGVSAMWADVDDDGRDEIIVTLSDSTNGGQIMVYDDTGNVVAAGPGIGRGNRWRHQLAVAPFGPNGEIEIVDVLTPHIGGVVEFRAVVDGSLTIEGEVAGFTSHVIRSRNLDMAAAADFDSDGTIELLLPNQRRTELGAISRTVDGAQLDWSLEIGDLLTTNVGVARTPSGKLTAGVGRADRVLRVWSWS